MSSSSTKSWWPGEDEFKEDVRKENRDRLLAQGSRLATFQFYIEKEESDSPTVELLLREISVLLSTARDECILEAERMDTDK